MTICAARKNVIFLILWIVLTTISLALVGYIFHYPSSLPANWGTPYNISGAPFGFIIGAMSGLMLGVAQWVLLRRYIKNAKRWLLTTFIGLGVMHSIGDAFPFGQYLLGATILSAVLMSVMQWRILRDVLTRPSLWMTVNIIGWTGGYLIGIWLLNVTRLFPRAWTPTLGATQHAVLGATQGLVYAIVTGIVFVWLLSNTPNRTKPGES